MPIVEIKEAGNYLHINDKIGRYKIKVHVGIEECSESGEVEVNELIKKEDGCFEMKISEEEAISIDRCEKLLLQANYPAIRDAISRHLAEVSKKSLKARQ